MYGGEVSDERDVRRAAFVGPLRTAPMATSPHQRGGSGIGIRAFDDLIAAPSDRPSTRPPGGEMQMMCGQCGCLLAYPAGSSFVRCGSCGVINQAPDAPTSSSPPQQIECLGCHQTLMYPGGADRVRCAECGTVSPVGREQEFAYASCGGCGALLMYPAGAMHVRCAGCQAITRVTQHATGASGDATSASPIKAIFVEQPDRTMQLGVFQLA